MKRDFATKMGDRAIERLVNCNRSDYPVKARIPIGHGKFLLQSQCNGNDGATLIGSSSNDFLIRGS